MSNIFLLHVACVDMCEHLLPTFYITPRYASRAVPRRAPGHNIEVAFVAFAGNEGISLSALK